MSSSTRAVFAGGYGAPAFRNDIFKVEIATTGNAVDFGGVVSYNADHLAGFSNGHGSFIMATLKVNTLSGIGTEGTVFDGGLKFRSLNYMTFQRVIQHKEEENSWIYGVVEHQER